MRSESELAKLRRDMWLNLFDYSLVEGLARTFQYVRSGERETHVTALRLGGWAVVPALRFSITPNGPEKSGEVRVLRSGWMSRVSVRATETAAGRQLWAGGIDLQPRGQELRWLPQMRADLFQRARDRVGRSQDGFGSRVELGLRGPLTAGRRHIDLGFWIGYKGRGDLADAPQRETVLGSFSLGFTL